MVMLPSFIDWLLDIMNSTSLSSSATSTKKSYSLNTNITSSNQANDKARVLSSPVILSGVILAVQRCMDNFGGFLNPYYGRLVMASCR